MIKRLSIEHYKGFYEQQNIEFAQPDGQKNGSGLTLIVGPNNTGKTSVIEALLFTPSKKFRESERHKEGENDLPPKIIFEDQNGLKTEYTNIEGGSAVNMQGSGVGQFSLVPSRRYWNSKFHGEWGTSALAGQSTNSEIRNAPTLEIGPALKFILKDQTIKSQYDLYMKKLLPHFTGWTIDSNDEGEDYVKYKTFNTYHNSNLLGDGVISLFRIVAHLLQTEAAPIIIDEPELSIHPSAQKRLAQVISELSKDRQVIICTHSPYFVNWSDFINGAKFTRLNKHNDEKCTVSILDNTKNYASFISESIKEYQRPQLLDIAAKEILFSDRILFTEGQEDVGLLRKWMLENQINESFDIFGYGVGGETNMKLFLELAQDLGLQKVGALYDGNSISFSSDIAKYPYYKLLKHTENDIRDKPEKSIVGVFDSNGNLKPTHKDVFESIMSGFISYYSS